MPYSWSRLFACLLACLLAIRVRVSLRAEDWHAPVPDLPQRGLLGVQGHGHRLALSVRQNVPGEALPVLPRLYGVSSCLWSRSKDTRAFTATSPAVVMATVFCTFFHLGVCVRVYVCVSPVGREEMIAHAIQALNACCADDEVLTIENASIGVVGLGEEFHVLTEAEVAPYVRAVKCRLLLPAVSLPCRCLLACFLACLPPFACCCRSPCADSWLELSAVCPWAEDPLLQTRLWTMSPHRP